MGQLHNRINPEDVLLASLQWAGRGISAKLCAHCFGHHRFRQPNRATPSAKRSEFRAQNSFNPNVQFTPGKHEICLTFSIKVTELEAGLRTLGAELWDQCSLTSSACSSSRGEEHW